MRTSVIAFLLSIIVFALVMEADTPVLIVLGSVVTFIFLTIGLVEGYKASRD